MGMSASQARLIALTARMNDIEYQGQQINQQRTTLSNQVNALYNQLLEMSVPTPPSTSDYTKVQYSGTADASKFTLGNVVPTGKNDRGDNTYNIQFSYKRSGHSVSKSVKDAQLTKTSDTANFVSMSDASKLTSLINTETTVTKNEADKITEKPTENRDVLIEVSVADYKTWADKNKSISTKIYNSEGNECGSKGLPNDENAKVYIRCNSADLDKFGGEGGLVKDGAYDNVYGITENKNYSLTENINSNTLSQLNLYYYDKSKGGTPVAITSENYKQLLGTTSADIAKNLANVYQMTNGTDGEKFENPNKNYEYSVGTMPVYSMEEAASKFTESTYKEYLKALKNAFSEYASYTDEQLEDIAKDFSVYIEYSNGSIIPHFIRNKELSAIDPEKSVVTPYDYSADGTYTQTETKKDCQLEFDAATGRITRVGIVNNGEVSWIDVTAETVTDQDAYEEAFNDYEYEKNVYDKKQQEINAKTSIVQQQDKNLELKLTRLDNERNAVNTEIEAVKKVVSDNIEKSYKTFSG